MAARAEKNPVVKGHYPDITTPLSVTAPSADPRPGEDQMEGGNFAHGGPVPDPSGLLVPFRGIGVKFPKGEQAMHDVSLGHKGGKKGHNK